MRETPWKIFVPMHVKETNTPILKAILRDSYILAQIELLAAKQLFIEGSAL
ncbi:MAG: hypothetical protein ACFFE8_02060 [Candidatus Heimdallarchaeota archaeon]